MIEDLWYKNAVIYSLDLETFMDVNGDGVGDFEGLTRRLDYLHALGVDTIWLAPFQPTPNRDNGYDITDYYAVDPRHGNLGNFVDFIHKANSTGMRVIIDLVLNHTSIDHPWFREARKDPSSPYRNWYVWSDKKPADWNKGMVFPGVQESTWTYDEKAGAWYFHRFYNFQPDLNMSNPEVRAEVQRVIGYWIQLGVAGFRVDAVPFLLEAIEGGIKETELNFEHLHEIRRFLQWRRGDAVLLGEANVLPEETTHYFGESGEGIHLMFNFYVNQHMFYALASGDIVPLVEALEATRQSFPGAQWAHFLRNHDELDLGRLSEEERQIVYERFGPEEHMQLYDRGIRRRLSPMLGNRPLTELAYSLMFSLPGTPVIRYGDEIGMGENLDLKERNAVRTPMQWSDDPQAGFSRAEKLILPVIDKGPFSFKHVNVESQRRQSGSLLNWMTALIRLRKECPEIGWGDWRIIDTGEPQVLCMYYYWRGNSLVILHNFAETPAEVKLKIDDDGASRLVDLLSTGESSADDDGLHRITLEAYGYRWFRAGDLRHLLKRKDADATESE